MLVCLRIFFTYVTFVSLVKVAYSDSLHEDAVDVFPQMMYRQLSFVFQDDAQRPPESR